MKRIMLKNPERITIEFGKGIDADNTKEELYVEYDTNLENVDNLSTTEENLNSGDSEESDNGENNNSSSSDSDDDPYINISLKYARGEYKGTISRGREVYAAKRIHYENKSNDQETEDAADSEAGTYSGWTVVKCKHRKRSNKPKKQRNPKIREFKKNSSITKAETNFYEV